ncbi:MAG: patatin-like phospholipase family protein [Betaproteobacteria bacterium]|nr:patatin-like phospholipase family protein [Betaproteobacteria bacterium]
MAKPRALQIHAGPRARAHLLERGLQAQDIQVIAGAAGGPKGLILLPLDAFVFGHWLPQGGHRVDLVGASIGAWRLAAACRADPVAALEQLGHDYIHERYGTVDGVMPRADVVSARFRLTLERHFPLDSLDPMLKHPRWKLHIITSRGRGLLRRPGRLSMPLGFAAAVALNGLSRSLLDWSLQRVWFSPDGQAPHWIMHPEPDLPTATAPLHADNFEAALLASCSIPFWLQPVQDITHAPPGPYWDGGLTDYHVHLPYHRLQEGLALVPHFQPRLVPGWLDKPWRHRHGATAYLDNAIVLSPTSEWLNALPGGKIPDRSDFKRYLHQPRERERLWAAALRASQQLADEWAETVGRASIQALPLP